MNICFEKMCMEDFKEMTFLDFIKVCDTLQLPVFEVATIFNPFSEPHKSIDNNMYFSMSEYREKMPSWSARNYDHVNDRVGGYYVIDKIPSGDFVVTSGNNHSDYKWHFQVLEGCVVVHSTLSFTD